MISELREQALMPEYISTCLDRLPTSINELIEIIKGNKLIPIAWHKVITERLFNSLSQNYDSTLSNSFSITAQIGLILYILTHRQTN